MYYRLTYISPTNREKRGDIVLNGHSPLTIGQGDTFDVQLPDSGEYEPEAYASILPCSDGKGWYLVRRTDCHQLSVNNSEVPVAQILHGGDKLTFSDGAVQTQLKFEVFDDGEYESSKGVVYKRHPNERKHLACIYILALIAFCAAIYALLASRQKDIRQSDLSVFNPSIYHITTDSLYLMVDTVIDDTHQQFVVEGIELSPVAEGTAFLTNDSLFITARHCIEPWLNDEEWDGVAINEKMSGEVRLAALAETYNHKTGQEKYILRSHCVISKGFERYSYYSTDFFINKSRDMVLRLGTPDNIVYWRTIFPLAHRRDMELGDFAYLKAKHLPANKEMPPLSLAGNNDLAVLGQSHNHEIAVIGYPLNDNDAEEVSVVYGNLMDLADSLGHGKGCIRMSAPINRGNSGGPVLAMIDGEIKVIGIVSKADARASQGTFWSVPINEVLNMQQQGNRIAEMPLKYRR